MKVVTSEQYHNEANHRSYQFSPLSQRKVDVLYKLISRPTGTTNCLVPPVSSSWDYHSKINRKQLAFVFKLALDQYATRLAKKFRYSAI